VLLSLTFDVRGGAYGTRTWYYADGVRSCRSVFRSSSPAIIHRECVTWQVSTTCHVGLMCLISSVQRAVSWSVTGDHDDRLIMRIGTAGMIRDFHKE
jgi:hypothetical protein